MKKIIRLFCLTVVALYLFFKNKVIRYALITITSFIIGNLGFILFFLLIMYVIFLTIKIYKYLHHKNNLCFSFLNFKTILLSNLFRKSKLIQKIEKVPIV